MGNCQAAEAATVVIQHPSERLERVHWQLKANEVMGANPGYYVAVIVTTMSSASNSPVRHLKLLRPDDTLLIGHVYHLISFEEVLREFGSRKKVRLNKFLMSKQENRRKSNNHRERKARGGTDGDIGDGDSNQENSSCSMMVEAKQEEEETHQVGNSNIDISSSGGSVSRHRQWRPTLQSIAETVL
ncbi:uncharacterized protein LOC103721612 [Phoenix dactylifera]|uniref:Uncharacterized protein LOC103721612 n=1 Tax=Phoenix dactylifera TaxID=42345 RepID=A0A8B8ZW60_PHODC|nr:uncharacterized protein LOC103721612 [Phoenix dactylifera]